MRGRKTILTEKHVPVGDEAVRRFLIKQGYTYKKKSLHAKEQERPRCAEKTQSMDKLYLVSNISRILLTLDSFNGCYSDQHAWEQLFVFCSGITANNFSS